MATPDTETRDGFSFRGDHLALDLCATLTGRSSSTPRDLLASPRDLARWLKAAGFARGAVAAKPSDLEFARLLRDAVYTLAVARSKNGHAPAQARAALNRFAEHKGAGFVLSEDGHVRLNGNVAALLATLAQDAVRMFGGEDAGRIRQCEAETCSRLFLDRSRARDRRWCSMSPCGNRVKVAEFRKRKQANA